METALLTQSEFWASPEPVLLKNPRRPDLPGEAQLRELMSRDSRLAGCVLLPTSGSTGEPKIVCLKKDALLASADAVNAWLGATAEDRWLCVLPWFHTGGLGIFARAFRNGARVFTDTEPWDAARFTVTCEEEGITLTSLVPTQVHDLVTAGLKAPESLRAVVVGGGVLAQSTGQAARKLGWPVLQSYGLTEASSQVATQGLEALERPYSNEWLPVLPVWECRAGRDEVGREVLEIRGSALFSAYLFRKGCGASPWVLEKAPRGGWFRTSDLVKLREPEEGSSPPCLKLKVLGRLDEVVKVLGELISLPGLREKLAVAFGDDASRATLIAEPDERKGHRLVAVVEDGVGEADLASAIQRYEAGVAPFERIDEIRRIPQLPRTELGKIQFGALSSSG